MRFIVAVLMCVFMAGCGQDSGGPPVDTEPTGCIASGTACDSSGQTELTPACSVAVSIENTRSEAMKFKAGIIADGSYATLYSTGLIYIDPGARVDLPPVAVACDVRALSAVRASYSDGSFFDNRGAWCEPGRRCRVMHTIQAGGVSSISL